MENMIVLSSMGKDMCEIKRNLCKILSVQEIICNTKGFNYKILLLLMLHDVINAVDSLQRKLNVKSS